jgi:hypothetical protein
MKKTNIIFWIITVLFCAFMLFTAIPEIMQTPDSKKFMQGIGYPDYINPFLGIMKILGIIAILVPGYPRLKEWAYAGLFFDLLGATYSLVAVGGLDASITFMLLPIAFLFVSYYYFHKRMRKV